MTLNKRTLLILSSTTLLVIIGFMVFSSFENEKTTLPDEALASTLKTPELLYEIDIDGYELEQHLVQPNEFLSTILQRYQVDMGKVHQLAENAKDIFDVRRISAGHPYTVFKNADGRADYFVYQPNKIDYVVYSLNGDLSVRKGQKEVASTVRTVTGVIENSLYQTLESLEVSPDMATILAEIYGWSVNFYRINKGDWFKIMYEHKEVDGETVGTGKVLSAVFNHHGREYEAYYYETEEEGKGTYYDEAGNSLRRAFLKAPIKYSRISSRFSPRRLHPVQKVWKAHLGTDFAAPTGTPIVATGDGMVVASTYAGGNGNYVKIQHDNVYATQYLHMSKRAVKRGDRVKQGQVIGYVGSTGLATGPHVCYRFWKNGKQVDALAQEFPSAEPIGDKHRLAFNESIAQQRMVLVGLDPFNSENSAPTYEPYQFDMQKVLLSSLNVEEDVAANFVRTL